MGARWLPLEMLVLAASLALAVGTVLGMLGGGGAILMLPLLVYVTRVEPRAAIATSLFVVGGTSVVGAALHARRGAVKGRLGVAFGAAAMLGAFGGGRLAHHVPASVLLGAFGVVMLVTSLAMLRGRRDAPAAQRPMRWSRALPIGTAVGVVSGLVGAGGGFLIVPALTLFCGVAMREAIGTSLFVIALQSFAGFAGHVTHVALDWQLVSVVAGAAAAGAFIGARIGPHVSVPSLRRAFGFLVLGMSLFVLGAQLRAVAGFVFPLAPVLPTLKRDERLDRARRTPLRS